MRNAFKTFTTPAEERSAPNAKLKTRQRERTCWLGILPLSSTCGPRRSSWTTFFLSRSLRSSRLSSRACQSTRAATMSLLCPRPRGRNVSTQLLLGLMTPAWTSEHRAEREMPSVEEARCRVEKPHQQVTERALRGRDVLVHSYIRAKKLYPQLNEKFEILHQRSLLSSARIASCLACCCTQNHARKG